MGKKKKRAEWMALFETNALIYDNFEQMRKEFAAFKSAWRGELIQNMESVGVDFERLFAQVAEIKKELPEIKKELTSIGAARRTVEKNDINLRELWRRVDIVDVEHGKRLRAAVKLVGVEFQEIDGDWVWVKVNKLVDDVVV